MTQKPNGSSSAYNTKKLLQCKSFMTLNLFNTAKDNWADQVNEVDRPRLASIRVC